MVAPIADHAFFEQSGFKRLLCHDFLQITRFTAQIFDLVRRGRANCVASQPPLPYPSSYKMGHQSGLSIGGSGSFA